MQYYSYCVLFFENYKPIRIRVLMQVKMKRKCVLYTWKLFIFYRLTFALCSINTIKKCAESHRNQNWRKESETTAKYCKLLFFCKNYVLDCDSSTQNNSNRDIWYELLTLMFSYSINE